MLEIHCRAEAVDLEADELPREHTLEKTAVVAARGVASGGSATVAGRSKLKELRTAYSHAPRGEPQTLRALLVGTSYIDGDEVVAYTRS